MLLARPKRFELLTPRFVVCCPPHPGRSVPRSIWDLFCFRRDDRPWARARCESLGLQHSFDIRRERGAACTTPALDRGAASIIPNEVALELPLSSRFDRDDLCLLPLMECIQFCPKPLGCRTEWAVGYMRVTLCRCRVGVAE
jgi:hypothetical protein